MTELDKSIDNFQDESAGIREEERQLQRIILRIFIKLTFLTFCIGKDKCHDERTVYHYHCFIPNEEVRSVFLRAVKNDGWDEVLKAISASEALLKATLAMDERTVAQMIQEVHMQNSSSLVSNNEVSLSSVIALAYYSACRDYILIRQMPTGNGFDDRVFLPKRASLKPALVLELKWDKAAEGAISQIKKKNMCLHLKSTKGIFYPEFPTVF